LPRSEMKSIGRHGKTQNCTEKGHGKNLRVGMVTCASGEMKENY
jgi:hypothetical protein